MKLSLAAKKMIMVIGASALLIMIGGAIYYRSLEALAFALGALLTSGFNVVKVCMLERNVQKILDMTDAGESKNFIRGQSLIRYVLTGAVLVVAAITPFINLWGAIIGVFTMQISAFALRFLKIDDDDEGGESA